MNIEKLKKAAEEWFYIPNHYDYEISSYGRVRSWISFGRYPVKMDRPRILKLCKKKHGYLTVTLKAFTKQVHTLVLESFVSKRPEGMQACHNDGNPSNNHLSNLRWDTPRNNQLDREKHGTSNHGTRNGNSKLNPSDVIKIRNHHTNGMKDKKIAEIFGVSRRQINRVRNSENWNTKTAPASLCFDKIMEVIGG